MENFKEYASSLLFLSAVSNTIGRVHVLLCNNHDYPLIPSSILFVSVAVAYTSMIEFRQGGYLHCMFYLKIFNVRLFSLI